MRGPFGPLIIGREKQGKDMSSSNLKEQLQKKSLLEIETMILDLKRKMEGQSNLTALHQLNSELNVLQEIREQKLKASGRLIRSSTKSPGKPELKSYDDYVKSKK